MNLFFVFRTNNLWRIYIEKNENEAHDKREYWCKICQEPFSIRKSLWFHMESHKNFKCPIFLETIPINSRPGYNYLHKKGRKHISAAYVPLKPVVKVILVDMPIVVIKTQKETKLRVCMFCPKTFSTK